MRGSWADLMDRQALDMVAREILGRPLTDDEAAFVANACVAMGLGEGDILVRLLIIYASLMTFLGRTLAAVEASRSPSALLRRHPGMSIGFILSIAALVGGAFAFGRVSVADRSHQDITQTLRWALSPEGERARRLSDSGLLRALDACSIPGWSRQGSDCFPGPDPESGTMRGIRITP
ncbi:MAG: hypothetical protein C0458_18650 [Methylobacterium sp.]|nr:hypothetical protein [Methylobacterium sp.]